MSDSQNILSAPEDLTALPAALSAALPSALSTAPSAAQPTAPLTVLPTVPQAAPVSALDPLLLENLFQCTTDETAETTSGFFFAFNTQIALKAKAEEALCQSVFREIHAQCKRFEHLFSRHLPHSDIARLNGAQGNEVEIAPETAELLKAACHYCAQSEGTFDISIGAALKLWDFSQGVVPSAAQLAAALPHIDWHLLQLRSEDRACGVAGQEGDAPFARTAKQPLAFNNSVPSRIKDTSPSCPAALSEPSPSCPAPSSAPTYFARLADPQGVIDVGGIAKGYIADKLSAHLEERGIFDYIINLGGNVVVRGTRPDGSPWRVGIQDPTGELPYLQAIEIADASAVTSGTYERSFTQEGTLYHHILDPTTGMPVNTDVAGVTVVAKRSLDAEGYSTTLLALGIKRGCAFVRQHDEILAAYFVDSHRTVTEAH